MKKPAKPPYDQRVLSRYVDAYARETGLEPVRIRQSITYMALAGALQAAESGEGRGPAFVVKGAVALQLRLRERARTTKDLDLILDREEGDLLEALARALDTRYDAFTFTLKDGAHLMPNGALRARVQVKFRKKPWATVEVDVARREGDETEVEMLPGVELRERFGIDGPEVVPCISLRHHVAQKIHGMTMPAREGALNTRFRDLVDLLLMRELVEDHAALREACERVFAERATHPWPPEVHAPEHWREPFARMAREVRLPIGDVDRAVGEIRGFVVRIAEAGGAAVPA